MTTMLSLILAFMLSIGGSPAGFPGNTGIQAPIDNNPNISRFFEDYNQKTASRTDLKKILKIPLIKKPKTQIRLRFTLYLKEELRLMGYMDSFNLYEAFNNNPLTYIDPYGTSSKKDGINPLAARSAYSRIFKYYISRGMDRDQASAKAMEDLVYYGYIEDKYELKVGTAVTSHTGFFYTAMHYVVLPVFEMSPAGIFKDSVSLFFGKDLVYGTKLKWWNYAMVAVPFIYETFKIGRGLGLADEFLDFGKALGNSNDIIRTRVLKNIEASRKARASSNFSQYGKWDKIYQSVNDLDFSTLPDKAVFYAGAGNRKLALAFAERYGYSTIHSTAGGRHLGSLELLSKMPFSRLRSIWARASEKFARSASGKVTIFLKGGSREGIFGLVEEPILKLNFNVTRWVFRGY